MQLNDSFVLDGVRRTSDGYLAAFARVARTGVQTYRGSELGRPDLDTVRVYRPAEEVFSADALRSFAHRPVTLRHPNVPVTSKNWKKYAGGQTGDEVVRDGDFVRVPMVMMDQALIDAYERDGIKELSMGYSTDIQWRAGVTDSGEPYDAVQTAIRGNHLAVVPLARGGDQLRIGDEDVDDDDLEINDAWSDEARKAALESRLRNSKNKSKLSPEEMHAAMERLSKVGSSNKPDASEGDDLPKTTEGHYVYNDPDGETHHITRRSDGSFHGRTSKYDYSAKNVEEMRAKIKRMGLKKLGYNKDEGDYTMKLIIDGVPVNVADDQSGAIIERHIASLSQKLSDAAADLENFKKKKKDDEEQLEDAKKTISAKDGEIAVLKKQVEDAKVTPEKLDALVKDRLAVVDKARPMLDKSYSFDGKTVEQVRKDAVTAKLGDAVVKHMNDAAIEGAFAALTPETKGNGASQIGDALRNRPHTVVADERTTAYDEMVKRQESAWKTPSAA